MTLTNLFFNMAVGISVFFVLCFIVFFVLCFIVLFVDYMMIYHSVNKNFKAVHHD